MFVRVTNLIAFGFFWVICFFAPSAVQASILADDLDLGSESSSSLGAAEMTPSSIQQPPDLPQAPDFILELVGITQQTNSVSGNGSASAGSSSPFSQSMMSETIDLESSPQLAFRVGESTLILPSPCRNRLLRPPQA